MSCNNACIGTPEQNKKFDAVLAGLKGEDAAMVALQKAQDIFGYVPIEVQQKIANHLGTSLEKVYGVSTFYSQFALEPKGKHVISVCLGTACYVKGAGDVFAKMESVLGVKGGQTTKDGKFTLASTRCLGCCALAPVFTIDGEVYGEAKPDKVEDIFKKYN
jgi:NADP-reducing hydrogenase subunit HndA